VQKVDSRIETIFSHAVALNQSGRLRNTIYVIEKEIYILNSDRSVLLKFTLPASALPFNNPISFKASDYDSNKFYEKDGKIVFQSKNGEYVKEKSCGVTGTQPDTVRDMFSNFSIPTEDRITIKLSSKVLSLLDEQCSHIEISIVDKKLELIQRNIYDGTVIRIVKEETGLGLGAGDTMPYDYGPIGLRTPDFVALFSFNDLLSFHLSKDAPEYIRVVGRNYKMQGVISCCLYDEMGTILTLKENDNGRKIKKGRRRKQSPDRPVKKRK
jgi:hypothetical protein